MRRLTPLVGRGELLAAAEQQISTWLECTHDPSSFDLSADKSPLAARNRLLVVTGPPAVGKSRLAYELVQRLSGRLGVNNATAHCTETASLSAFAAEIAQVAGLDGENLPDKWEALCRHTASAVSQAFAERARRHLPLLALLLDCKAVDTAGIRQADIGSYIPGVKLALRACCELIAHHNSRPVVLVIEDLQWMGSLREVIADLLHYARLPQPLIVLGTARPEFTVTAENLAELVGAETNGAAGNGDRGTTRAWRVLELPPLSRLEGERLVREVVPRLKLPAELEEELARKAAGLPYYYEEFARLLLSRHLVIENEDELSAAADLSDIELPEGLAELIQNRLAGLEPGLRDLTGRAAVIGRSFSGERLRRLEQGLGLTDTERTTRGLAELEQHQLLASEAGDHYFFEHALTRDAAYAMLPGEDRIEMHRAMAAALEEMLVPGTASEWDVLPELIRHLEGCGRCGDAHEKACELLTSMAETGRIEQWPEWSDRAKKLWDASMGQAKSAEAEPGGLFKPEIMPESLSTSPAMHTAICRLCTHQGQYEQAKEHAETALEIAEALDSQQHRMLALLALGTVCDYLSEYESAQTYTEKALSISRSLGERKLEAQALSRLRSIYLELGNLTKMEVCLRTMFEMGHELGNKNLEGRAYGGYAVLCDIRGELDESRSYYLKSLAISREVGDLSAEAYTLTNLAIQLAYLGETGQARDCLEKAQALSRETGERFNQAKVDYELGNLLMGEEQYTEAGLQYEHALEIFRELRSSAGIAWTLSSLGALKRQLGEREAAKQTLRQALSIAVDIGETQLMISTKSELAAVLVKMQEFPEAAQLLEQATEALLEQGHPILLGLVYCNWVEYHLALARQSPPDGRSRADCIRSARTTLAQADSYANMVNEKGTTQLKTRVAELAAQLEMFEIEPKTER